MNDGDNSVIWQPDGNGFQVVDKDLLCHNMGYNHFTSLLRQVWLPARCAHTTPGFC